MVRLLIVVAIVVLGHIATQQAGSDYPLWMIVAYLAFNQWSMQEYILDLEDELFESEV